MTQAAPHPRMHGLTHVPGGPDPVPGLLPRLPSGTVEEIILATLPGAYYKLDETGTDVWHDSSGADRHATYFTRAGTVRGVAASLDEGDGALCVTVDGGTPTAGMSDSAVGYADDPYFAMGGTAEMTVSALIRLAAIPSGTFSMGVCGNTDTGSGSLGWSLLVLSDNFDPDSDPAPSGGKACFRRQESSGVVQQVWTPTPLAVGVWYRVTGVFDGVGMGLWLNDSPVAGVTTGTASLPTETLFRIGSTGVREGFGGNMAPFQGEIDSVIVWDRALTAAEIEAIVAGGAADVAAAGAGQVLTVGEDGTPVWAPPGVEVTHGDGEPVEAPVTSPPSLSGPTTGSGWHTNVHTETAVLYDSSPARFDVPSRTWTRVPFNTVRIQRQWETTVNGPVKSAWLADDRGLTSQARNGLLHITAEMGSPQDVSGWYSIEYPILDFTGLPDYSGETGVDAYARAARIVDASGGTVIRETPGSADRQFFEWLFRDFAADGLVGIEQYAADSPYPVYASWGARPLLKPGPYPQIDPVSSLTYYKRDAFYGGFAHEYPVGVVDATLAAGANLCLQAWQDTPWPLRFSTDHFPNYTPMPYPEAWKQRPYLAVSYTYDPDSINHTTGALL